MNLYRLGYLLAFVLALQILSFAQDTCPYPVPQSLTCEKDRCKQTVIVSVCSGPASDTKCDPEGAPMRICCGDEVPNARKASQACTGPAPQFVSELRRAEKALGAEIWWPHATEDLFA